ncbi:DUF2627 domain-containing protein [Aquisalibacillus elongatus]|uniref:Uncharacterized protein DUF2627 n=1 Tax=Aquisalibacillus elongatus TaxID=485577 RepID=A0A3N5BFM0_9BACI|nr:DUF2627 domain-containing protein [Aquisalibacillus elongatus]RPF55679.1 uncharacterized protein DUF2627 [Aquisalibacillus elongatus]
MVRLIAFIILLIPGIVAVYGIKLIRDSFFGILDSIYPNVFLQLFFGFVFVVLGIGFIGGYLLHRDRKKNKTKGRFEANK